jgi:hypothetical protein
MATISSPARSDVVLGPVRKSSRATTRLPLSAEATSTVASSAANTGSVSPAGEAVARFPPSVPVLRICGLPTVRAAWDRAGASAATAGSSRLV